MGTIASRFKTLFTNNNGRRFLMIGLDAAGKTTILYKTNLGEIVNQRVANGLNVKTVKHEDLSLTVLDIGGQPFHRRL